jgi:hypothetical protein
MGKVLPPFRGADVMSGVGVVETTLADWASCFGLEPQETAIAAVAIVAMAKAVACRGRLLKINLIIVVII